MYYRSLRELIPNPSSTTIYMKSVSRNPIDITIINRKIPPPSWRSHIYFKRNCTTGNSCRSATDNEAKCFSNLVPGYIIKPGNYLASVDKWCGKNNAIDNKIISCSKGFKISICIKPAKNKLPGNRINFYIIQLGTYC